MLALNSKWEWGKEGGIKGDIWVSGLSHQMDGEYTACLSGLAAGRVGNTGCSMGPGKA